jgi:hypothetical protein
MGNVLQWLIRPRLTPGDDAASAWRLRVWAAVAAMFLTFLLMSMWEPFVVLVIVAVAYWAYAVARMLHARVRSVHIPSRDELRERYMDDPDGHL